MIIIYEVACGYFGELGNKIAAMIYIQKVIWPIVFAMQILHRLITQGHLSAPTIFGLYLTWRDMKSATNQIFIHTKCKQLIHSKRLFDPNYQTRRMIRLL